MPSLQHANLVVIGGGISGLAAAHRAHELAPSQRIMLLEAGRRLGGVLETTRQEGFLIEGGADNFITAEPDATDLCRRIGLADQLIAPTPQGRRAFTVHRGRLRPIPSGFVVMAPSRLWPIVATPILSPAGKLRMAGELFVPPKLDGEDESLAEFSIRRFGREAFERLVQPLVGGIYTGDPWRLSVQSTMPRFVQMERSHGSLIRAMGASGAKSRPARGGESGARYGMFVALRDGMASLVNALAARLPRGSIRLQSPVERLTAQPDGRWRLQVGGPSPVELVADAVILAAPAPRAARLAGEFDRELGALLDRIEHTGCAIVSLGYRRQQIGHRLNGFGFVTPHIEGRRILSGSFSSVKYVGRAPYGAVLVKAILGGALHAEMLQETDERLQQIAAEELADLLKIRGEPVFRHISRRENSMPQYYLGHAGLVERIESRAAKWPRLALAGNAYRGVGVPHCIRSGEAAAQVIVDQLARCSNGPRDPQTFAANTLASTSR